MASHNKNQSPKKLNTSCKQTKLLKKSFIKFNLQQMQFESIPTKVPSFIYSN